jgi:hypothetical protein
LELIFGEDYYMEDGLIVMTATYHKKRGNCCGSGCRWCPYEPRHQAGATIISTAKDLFSDAEITDSHQPE